jgi:hypothetical protein
MVALTTLDGLLEPSDLLKMSLIPADSSTARTFWAGDDAGAGRGRTQHHFGAAIAAENFVRNGRILQGNGDHPLLGHFAPFADGFGNFDRLAQAEADAAVFVAGDDQRAETEAAAAFDDFGGTVDENHFFAQLGTAAASASARRLRENRAGRGADRGAGAAVSAASLGCRWELLFVSGTVFFLQG